MQSKGGFMDSINEENFLELQYAKPNLFKDESVFEISYIPAKIKHRNAELMLLSNIFIRLIERPFEVSKKVLIEGPIGIGKTLVSQKFKNMLEESVQKRNLNVKCISINCREEKTSYKAMRSIMAKLNQPVPERGLSPEELFGRFKEHLKSTETYVLLIMDELDHLIQQNFELIYSLTRFNDSDFSDKQYVSLIGIVRDVALLKNLDNSTLSSLQGNIITLKRYNEQQIKEILEDRIALGFKLGVISDELIQVIIDNIRNSGDIRTGLNILKNAGKIAEYYNEKEIKITHIREAMKNIIPNVQDDFLSSLEYNELIWAKSIVDTLEGLNVKSVGIHDIKRFYESLCEKHKIKPRANTQLWEYSQKIKQIGLITIKVVNKNPKGRASLISIDNIPLNTLDEKLLTIINRKTILEE